MPLHPNIIIHTMSHPCFLPIFSCLILFFGPSCQKGKSEALASNPEPPAEHARDAKIIHTYVALCDNKSQGIAPVPEKIGNGDDPANNLYWGCSDGSRSYFEKSKRWKRLSAGKVDGQQAIMQRLVFQHQETRAILVIDAWRGSTIEPCIEQFIQSIAGQHYESLTVNDAKGSHTINIGGGADFLCFIGHNGLMEFSVPALPANPKRKQQGDVAILCCQSDRFFQKHLGEGKHHAVLTTASNMYPGAFILHDTLEGWFKGESRQQLRQRAAKAYAKNQKISTKSALTVFSK
ncbi:hypothetical protein HW115_07560 [Verrucomicrobiaceae bacterium N1E253]|uniref:Uncharacterized protein n=1 Tax=Oceaniferula marina TaxID=2748318 RepID=A0A851GD39_9BACT|nr:hypothetical protein [Oceaniferula marina]NWK55463.1 hypothetical protein [Oceaniferula marina]